MDYNSLNHAGIKGMRWGVRRYQNSDGTLTDAGKKRYSKRTPDSEDHTRAKALKKKKLRQLSNDELRELNTRIQLETQYKDLKKKNINSGRKFANEVVREAAKKTVSSYVSAGMKKGINKAAEVGVKAAYKAAART